MAIVAGLTSPAQGRQNGRPEPQQPQSQASPNGPAEPRAIAQTPPTTNGGNGSSGPLRTRQPAEGKVTLAFNDVAVDEKITAFIAEATGKVVMPVNLAALKAKKITLMNDEPVERALALDLLLTALRLNGIGVIENDQIVVIDLIENMKNKPELVVLTPEDDVLKRSDRGTIIVKMYRLKEAAADSISEHLQENLPDYASLVTDVNANMLILYGDVGLAQQLQRMINELDRVAIQVKTETYRLAYADATSVSDQIYELFDDSGGAQTTANRNQQNQQRGNQQRGPGNQGNPNPGAATPAGLSQPGVQVQLRVSVNVQQNSVTVSAEPKKVDAIGRLIREQWDLALPPENAKVYTLRYTDPLKVRDLIQNLLGAGGGSSSNTGNRAQAPRGAQQFNQAGGAGGGGSVSDVIGDIYRIEAFPDQNTVIVVSKTKQSLDYLDKIIEAIDQPSNAGLPMIIELKYANAFELADELNILLAEAGTGNGLQRPGSGLTAQNNLSSLAEDETGTGQGTPTDQQGGAQETMEFPWQNAQPRDDQSDPSSLIGKVRIVPIERQNALAILAPVAQQLPVQQLISSFDKPGRQVMISAIVAEVELTDELALGIRMSSQELVSSIADGSVAGNIGFEGTNEGVFGSLFDTSVLDANVDLNVLIQAISQKTNVRILQEPRVFTADNQEAVFFKGQDVPFVTNTNTSDVSGFQQNIEYQAVGVQLDVRPRITAQRDVNMEVNLVLSSIVPGQTVAGSFILDRRETTTNVIVKNNQTIVLSGILTDTESSITRGIPLLQDIPWIGELFKSRENSKKTTELIAFITPTVVDNPDENDHNFNEAARQRLRSLSLPLKEQAKHQDAIRDRILAPSTSSDTPIAPTAETELNRIREEAAAEERIKEFDRLSKEAEKQGKEEGKKQAEEQAKELMKPADPPATQPAEEPNSP